MCDRRSAILFSTDREKRTDLPKEVMNMMNYDEKKSLTDKIGNITNASMD